MNRAISGAVVAAAIAVPAGAALVPDAAAARCATLSAYYNGTGVLGPGPQAKADFRLQDKIAAWAKKHGIKRPRVGRVRRKCGDWYFTPFLPHQKCTSTARVCG